MVKAKEGEYLMLNLLSLSRRQLFNHHCLLQSTDMTVIS